jgi:dihydroorotate dehydrogenase
METLNVVRDSLQESLANLIDHQESAVRARYIAVKIGVDLDDVDMFNTATAVIKHELDTTFKEAKSVKALVPHFAEWLASL